MVVYVSTYTICSMSCCLLVEGIPYPSHLHIHNISSRPSAAYHGRHHHHHHQHRSMQVSRFMFTFCVSLYSSQSLYIRIRFRIIITIIPQNLSKVFFFFLQKRQSHAYLHLQSIIHLLIPSSCSIPCHASDHCQMYQAMSQRDRSNGRGIIP